MPVISDDAMSSPQVRSKLLGRGRRARPAAQRQGPDRAEGLRMSQDVSGSRDGLGA